MTSPRKKRAQVPKYVSPNQLVLAGFESPFDKELNPSNRWIVLAHLIPWDEICNMYFKFVPKGQTGRPALNPRIVIGSLIIKHMCNLDDRETVDQISENIYMQYFLGYPSFSNDKPFDASLFVDFRKRLGMENLNAINEKIVAIKTKIESSTKPDEPTPDSQKTDEHTHNQKDTPDEPEHKGRVIYDATACPQDIAYPTDLNLLNDAREKLEELIDHIYTKELHQVKPRTYREVARKKYLQTAQKKNKSRKVIRRANRCQLNLVRRDISIVNELLDVYQTNNLKFPLNPSQQKYFFVVQTLYDQQKQMFDTNTHSVEHRIVSIHQPHVRPIVRGKAQAKVEFGSKIHVSIIDGISFLDELSWDAFNEGSHMLEYVQKYRKRFGCYPREILADQIYCTRVNRAALKELGIKLLAKPLGRPSALSIHVSPGERNPIEGKFGQAKTGYGLNRIKARLKGTSESWIASIILVLNLVKLAGVKLLRPIINFYMSFSARLLKTVVQNLSYIFRQIEIIKQTDDSRQILCLSLTADPK